MYTGKYSNCFVIALNRVLYIKYRITRLYIWNKYNIVNHIYFSKKRKSGTELNICNHEKKKILTFGTTGMTLDDFKLSEICQIQKEKYFMISFIWGMLKSQTHRAKE